MVSTSTEITQVINNSSSDVYYGILLAVSSSFFIGSSFIFKKKSLLKLNVDGTLRAGDGGFGYLKDILWWIGLLLMGIGEVANFAAYAFAPASLVTPLGALSVLVSSVLAAIYLHEKFNIIRQMGSILCLLGSTVIVIHAPKEEEIQSLDELAERLRHSGFLSYLVFVVVVCLLIFCYLGPVYGNTYVIVYITFCSAVGSVTVMACKGLALAIRFGSVSPNGNALISICLFVVVAFCICMQMNYLNKALDLFSTSVVTPVYYVLFTSFVLSASGILFEEWKNLPGYDILGCICGFLITVIAIYMLCTLKDVYLYANQSAAGSRYYGSVGCITSRT